MRYLGGRFLFAMSEAKISQEDWDAIDWGPKRQPAPRKSADLVSLPELSQEERDFLATQKSLHDAMTRGCLLDVSVIDRHGKGAAHGEF